MTRAMAKLFTLAIVLSWTQSSAAVAADEDNPILGKWKMISLTVQDGEKVDVAPDVKVSIEKDKMTRTAEGMQETVLIKLDPTKLPKQIDITIVGPDGASHLVPGIYKLDGDKLTIKTGKPKDLNAKRPTGFDDKTGVVTVLERLKKEGAQP